MGSISSNSKENYSRIKESKEESSYDYELKTENTTKNKNEKNISTIGQSETSEYTKILDSNELKIPYKFEWKEGGCDVKIAGSFLNNWKEQKIMKKNLNTGFFEIIINIPKGINQFKFIVDNKWACSPDYTKINEKNNTNNIIDTTNYNPNEMNDNESVNSKEIKKKKKKLKKDENDGYNCNFPKLNDINDGAPNIPPPYINIFDLNNHSNQDIIITHFSNFLNFNMDKNKIENDTFKTIMPISHDKLQHICCKEEYSNNDGKNKFIGTAITQRNKHKFLTIIYYRPKKDD